jgi:hypothetical protein
MITNLRQRLNFSSAEKDSYLVWTGIPEMKLVDKHKH